jgi:hypothetical protein
MPTMKLSSRMGHPAKQIPCGNDNKKSKGNCKRSGRRERGVSLRVIGGLVAAGDEGCDGEGGGGTGFGVAERVFREYIGLDIDG